MENHLNLTEEQGYRLTYDRAVTGDEKKVEIEGKEYITARDLVGQTGGRITAWKLLEHLESARERNWPFVRTKEFTNGTVAICGSGPSIGKLENLKRIREIQRKGGKIHAINRCHDFLRTKGIIPDSASLLDPIPHVATYIKPQKGTDYFIGAQCHPDTFDVFEKAGLNKFIWFCRTTKMIDAHLTEKELAFAIPSRTSTNGLRSVMLNYMRGFRSFHLFGFDSSYETFMDETGVEQIALMDGKGKLHAHSKPETIHDVRTTKVYETSPSGELIYEKEYFTNSAMLSQADEFQTLISDIAGGIKDGFMEQVYLYVHGDGLIPDIACSQPYQLHFDRKRNRTNV